MTTGKPIKYQYQATHDGFFYFFDDRSLFKKIYCFRAEIYCLLYDFIYLSGLKTFLDYVRR